MPSDLSFAGLMTAREQPRARSSATGEYLDQLVGWWALDEASGNALDSHTGGLTLTDNNSVGAAESGRDFEASSSQFFNRASGAEFQCGNIAYTFAFWIKPESFPNFGDTTHLSHAKNDYSFVDYQFIGDGPQLRVYNSPGGGIQKTATPSGFMSAGTLYFIAGGLDAVDGNVWVSRNAGTRGTTALAGMVPVTAAGQFNLGRYAAGESFYTDGIIKALGFWKRALTDDELTWLYNGGTPRTYAAAAAV